MAPERLDPIGAQIGPYRIESKLGEGGMGMVFRAQDTRLNRPVAIKFLADDVADAAARRRFQREAQTASALNHPHILTVHDTGEFEGRQYLVTEFVDGGTLRDWARGQNRSWQEIVELLVGVADGLAAAHEAGITHRDIKPANILVGRNGYAKLADFGLAKLVERVTPEDATRTHVTRPGVVMGTVGYMSPEQASGRAADARSDVFAFGVVLYELIVGQRPFAGSTDLEELQTIIHGAPRSLPGDLPPALRLTVEKAIEKDPADRYQSMREMAIDLRRLLRQSGERTSTVAVPPRRFLWKVFAWAAGLTTATVLGVALLVTHLQQPAAPPAAIYTPVTSFDDAAFAPALSADGRMLAFIRGSKETMGGPGDIYIKLLPDGAAVQLTHDGKSKMTPVFTPAGDRIAYGLPGLMLAGVNWTTWTVPVFGGEPTLLLSNSSALSWIPGANPPRVLFSELGKGVHMSVVSSAENRSEERTIYSPANPGGMAHRSFLSPDGKQMLVAEMQNGWLPCRLVPFEGGPGRLVGPSPGQCVSAGWSPDGKWMYFSVNTGNGYHIWRQTFPNGTPEQVTAGATEEQDIVFAPDGRSFYTSVGSRQSTLWVHDARGERQITSEGYASQPQFSADAKKLFFLLRSRDNRTYVSGELWAADVETGRRERLLPDFLLEHYDLARDGNRIAFVAIDDAGRTQLWLGTLDGRVQPRKLSTMNVIRAFFGAPGELLFAASQGGSEIFVYRVREDGSGLEKALPNPVNYFYNASPEGKAMATWSGGPVQVAAANGDAPVDVSMLCLAAGGENRGITPPCVNWSPDGKYFYVYHRDKGVIYAAPLPAGRILPPLPAGGIRTPEQAAALPGVGVIREKLAFVGPNPSVYAFFRASVQSNIYRISVR
ncbi:MAG TPA: protein kinase [Bryobacteraceae bacterium]|jgi:Tol biopolymer transport system component/predicted Ser/Thr protein kinase